MNKNRLLKLQLFAPETNTTVKADLEPAISIDCASNLTGNIKKLQEVLGIADMDSMPEGTNIKIYKMEQVNTPTQVAEGETITLTKIKRTLARTIELTLKKYRKNTTAEAIQKTGREVAINKTDEKLISGVQKEIKKSFYDVLMTGTGTATGTTFQSALAAAWGALQEFYEDEDATPIHFVSSKDVAEYLGTAQLTLQTAFGMSYVEDFLGLGTLVINPNITKGKVVSTAKENLHGAYVPANSGDVAQTFDLTSDSTGLVGITHQANTTNATVDTLVLSGVVFYPELLDGVFVTSITPATTDQNTDQKTNQSETPGA